MKLSLSNIAWKEQHDTVIYEWMKSLGFTGLEIAPTRIFPQQPYAQTEGARRWREELTALYGLHISSMQSIWYGKTERIFYSKFERNQLLNYTKQAIVFASVIGCTNLVFGSPKNRTIPAEISYREAEKISRAFFGELGAYALEYHTVLSLEANPTMYGTNYLNDTASALELVDLVNSDGIRVNLDVGTMIANQESVDALRGMVPYIHHVHLSEPGLAPIQARPIHRELVTLLKQEGYSGYLSIEMAAVAELETIRNALHYVRSLVTQ